MFTRREIFAMVPAAFLCSCSATPPAKQAPEKPAEPITGLHALYQLYTSARAWAQDLEILLYSSINIAEVPRQPGKAAAWQAVFASRALGKRRTYTFSVFEASATLHQGIFDDAPENWSGSGKPFSIQAAAIDTDSVWKTALEHSADSGANPDSPISWILALDAGSDPMWRVIWGESAGESNFSVLVDATTGDFVRVLH